MSLSTTAYILALLTSAGGIAGYARTGSIPSIAAGLTIGGLYTLSGYRLNPTSSSSSTLGSNIKRPQPYALEIAVLASLVLTGSSLPRAIRSQGTKPVPLALSVVGIFGLVRFGYAWLYGGQGSGGVLAA